MENGGGGGGAKTATRFGFSWADEVEREEREQVAMEQVQQPRREAKREQIKADPFGAARPREVVLAEKGVDWRARDRELDLGPAPRPPRSAHRRAAAAAAEAAPGRASGASASACTATPARGVPRERDAGRTPHPRRRQAPAPASTPRPPTGHRNAPSAGRSARGGSKRKFAGEGPARRARPVTGDHAEQGRRVFGELNIGEERVSAAGNSCSWNCNPGGSQTEGMEAAVAGDGAPSKAVTAIDESAAGRKRSRGGKRRKKGRGSGNTQKQQTPLV